MAQINDERLDKLAFLAQIDIAPGERAEITREMERLIEMVGAVSAVDTAAVEPLAHPLDQTQTLRPDVVTESNQRSKFQALAPASENGQYLVPRVVE